MVKVCLRAVPLVPDPEAAGDHAHYHHCNDQLKADGPTISNLVMKSSIASVPIFAQVTCVNHGSGKLAKTAMTQLEGHLEAIRKEGYEAGFAAAMQAIRQFADGPSAAAPAVAKKQRKSARAVKPQRPRSAATASKPQSTTAEKQRSKAQPAQPTRGANALLIAEVLKRTHGPTRAADIRKALQRDKGVSIAFTSIRHALNQLAERGEVKVSADHKEWYYVGAGS